MFRSADSVGWAASKLIFIFSGHFVAERGAHFFDKPAGSSKNNVFLKVFAISTKLQDQVGAMLVNVGPSYSI